MYFVYVIYNKESKKFYIGQTTNLSERVSHHNNKEFKNSYTSRFAGEWEVVYKESYPDRVSALEREKQLKSYKGRQFVKEKILPL